MRTSFSGNVLKTLRMCDVGFHISLGDYSVAGFGRRGHKLAAVSDDFTLVVEKVD